MTDILEQRSEYIQSLLDEKTHDLTDQVIFALFSCFTPEQLGQLYIDNLESTSFRRKLQQHIELSIKENGSEKFVEFLERLFNLLAPYKSQRSIWINALLYRIIGYFHPSYIEKYFFILLRSHRRNDRDRACVLATQIWSSEIETMLWHEWTREQSEQCIASLIEYSSVDELKAHFHLIWNAKHLSDQIKRRSLFRIIESDFSFAEQIRRTHPITYLYCAARTGRYPSPDVAYKLSLKATSLSEMGIAIWCLGKFGYWETIVRINDEIPALAQYLRPNESMSPFNIKEESTS